MDDEKVKYLEKRITRRVQEKMEKVNAQIEDLLPVLHKYYWTPVDGFTFIQCVENIARAHYECEFHFLDENSEDINTEENKKDE